MTLLQRVLLLALPALIAVFSLSGWVGIGWAESAVGNRTKLTLEDFAALQVAKLGDELKLARSELRLIASERGVIAAARGSIAGSNLFLKLVEAQNNYPAFAEIEVFSDQNTRVASAANSQSLNTLRSAGYFADLKAGKQVLDIYADSSGEFLIIARALREEGRMIGMVTARMRIDALHDIINATHNGIATVETLWITNDGGQSPRLISTPHLLASNLANTKLNEGKFGELVHDSLSAVPSFTDNINDYRDEPVLAVSSYSPVTGWGLIVKADRSEIFQTIGKFQVFTALSTAVTTLLCMMALALVLRNVTQPLKQLTRDAMEIANLNSDEPLVLRSKNELKVLQEVHTRMRQRLQDEHQRLQSQVDERTNDLRGVNDQLIDLNRTLIHAQSRAEENDARLNLALRASLAGIWEWRSGDPDNIWMSARCSELLGRTDTLASNFDAKKFADMLDREGEKTSASMREALSQGETFQCNVLLSCGNRGQRWFKLAAAATLSEIGAIEHIAGSITDIQALKNAEEEVNQLVSTLENKARTDSLTGLANRRHFNETLDEELARARRYGSPLSALVIDADNFKDINDQHGHLTGDDILVALAQTIKAACRPVDFACRFGGEEFVVLMPETDVEGAAVFSERLRGKIEALQIRNKSGVVVAATVSIGVSQWEPGERGEDLIQRADMCVYQAKARGRNRIYKWPAPEPCAGAGQPGHRRHS